MFSRPFILSLALAFACAHLIFAQNADPSLNEMLVTSTPLGGSLDQQSQPVSLLAGDRLQLKLQPSLGETLAGEPGVSSTYYGPGASRPVIRGLDGERIKILRNGTATLDASAASVDHAVSGNPINVDHIEVVRGPATLLYGTSAVGGIVNVIDSRIPNERVPAPITGIVDLRYDSIGSERAGSTRIEGGSGNFAFHLDAFKRNAHNIAIPGDARSEALQKSEPLPAGEKEARDILPNSAIDNQGGAAGASWIWDRGYLGASFSGDNSNYGTVAEREVTIGMRQRRFDFAGAFHQPFSGIESIKTKLGVSDYQHIEYEGNTPGTKFENEGYDARIDLQQKQVGPLEGAFGFETQKSNFSALGEEAFLPPTQTLIHSVFAFEKIDLLRSSDASSLQGASDAPSPNRTLTLELGARLDLTHVQAEAAPAFGPARDRDFATFGLSSGIVYQPTRAYTLALSAAYTERAPSQQELFAKGPHIATLAFEFGDPDLGPEKSTGLDLSFRKTSGIITGSLTLFYNHFHGFIVQTPTGQFSASDEPLQIYRYRATEASFLGGEFQATWHLLRIPDPAPTAVNDAKTIVPNTEPVVRPTLDLGFRADYVRAQDLGNDQPLPRIPPLRIGSGLTFTRGPLAAHLDLDYYFPQNRHDPAEFDTTGYTMVSASVSYRFDVGPVTSELFIRGTNLLNEEARSSTSFLKEIAPLPARGIQIGLQTSF